MAVPMLMKKTVKKRVKKFKRPWSDRLLTVKIPKYVRSTAGRLGPGDKHVHSLPYIDRRRRLPVHVRIVDPSKDLDSYGQGNVDLKERLEGWKLK